MKSDGHYFTLTTGRKLYAFDGRLTPWSESRTPGSLCCGYDNSLYELDDAPLTPEERREIADHCIAQWERWARGEEEHR